MGAIITDVRTGSVDIYANHGMLIVGPEDWLPAFADWGDEPVSCDGRHLVVMTRGQAGHTRVSLWRGAMPVVGEPVFQGALTVEDHHIWVGDLERINRYVTLGHTGPQSITVCVDDPFDASRVYVGFGLGDAPVRVPLTAVDGHRLPDVLTSPDHRMVQVDELDLILSGEDSPLARLAGALKLTSRPRPGARAYPDEFDILLIAQWLRRLAWNLSFEQARSLCTLARDRIATIQPAAGAYGLSDHDALTLATQILGQT